ncbi:MAG: 30S ribosomal protein S1 [Candidatus Zixiibacteriota bacterium]
MVEERKPKDAPASSDKKVGAARVPRKGGEKDAKSPRRRPMPPRRRTEKQPSGTKGKAPAPVKKMTETKVEPPPEPIREAAVEPAAQPVVVEKPVSTLIRDLSIAVEKEYSTEEFEQYLKMYEPTLRDIQEGEIVKGKVMGVTKEDVIVDVGFKSEGIIPIAEFTEPINIKVGDEIEVYLDAIEDQDGQLVLSKQKADFVRIWDRVKDAHDKGELVDGRILRRIKGGMVVDLMGVDAFLPGSQIALRQVPDFDALLGQVMQFKVIKLNKARRNIVVSRRSVLEEERLRQKEKLLKEIETGQVREGVVKNITDFGVFIDLGGVDGLLHITDMSWGRISHPSELVALGDKINVKIIDFDTNTGRISLGMKQLTPYPWENIQERYPVGKKTKGKVVSLTDYGAFVELERGVEGLIHISEMSWTQHIKHPSRLMAIGDTVEAMVLSVDKDNEKISLGIKQLEPDPWSNIEQKYRSGPRVTGKVRNLTAFGAFIELEEGIDGLVHISDMSWTKRIQHPSEVMKKGDRVEVVVLNVDRENRRISLGYKQTKDDPWPELSRRYAVGSETSGNILRLLDRGVIVDLGEEVEGFVPTIHMGKPEISKPADAFNEGDALPLKVMEFDHPGKKIVLSVEAYYRTREKKELDDFLGQHPTKTQKVEDIVEKRPQLEGEKTAEAEKPVPAQPAASEPEPVPESETKTEEAKADAPSGIEEKAKIEEEAKIEEKAPASAEEVSDKPDDTATSTEEPTKETDA